MGIVASLIQFPIIFSVGRWIGRRCASHDIAVIFLSSFLARLIATSIDLWLLTPTEITALSSIHITPASLSLLIAQGTVTLALVSLIGYWRGRRRRLAAYLTYLLQSVSEDTRKAIVELAFEEARATTRAAGPNSAA